LLVASSAAHAQELLDILDDLNQEKTEDDRAKLNVSHLSLIHSWQGVRPARPAKDDTTTYRWAVNREHVSPLGKAPISTLIDTPQKGTYRIYLRHVLSQDGTRPVTLRITPLKRSGKPLSHTFGKVRLLRSAPGKEQEKKLPIKVESDLQLNTLLDPATAVWEHADVDLEAGAYLLELASSNKDVQVDALFLTLSKSFRPSFSYQAGDNTLQRIFMRFRLIDPPQTPPTYNVSAGLTYHWRGRVTPSGQVMWGHPIGSAKDVPAKEWSPFIDATEAIVPGPGAWSTCRVNLSGVEQARVEVQFAWTPHAAAVTHALTASVSQGRAMFRVPHGSPQHQQATDQPRWGVWRADHLTKTAAEAELVERYFTWAEEAAAELNLEPAHPRPKHLLFLSSCRVGPAHRERASRMLAKLGVNWVAGAPPSLVEQLGLHDDSDHKKIKIGDEIATYTPAESINDNPLLLAEFHRYLEAEAQVQGKSITELFGAPDTARLRCMPELPENPGRFERRLYYHSHRYCHQATIGRYAAALKAAEEKNPGAIVYNNYSPHPVFLTGNSMNTTDWFLLCRAGAQTLGWGEDWATNGSWGLGTDRTQCVSFYAALVDCAVRTHDYPSGFYVGSNTGNSAQKIFSCVAEGIDIMHLYDWGPIDAWAEGSNAWSEFQSQYKSIMTATHALGPADEIIGQGEREPRRTAILYNRAHEIMNGQTVALNHDWMWAFIAMKSAQIPVDVILEEDLTPAELAQYDVLYLGGLNLEERRLNAVADWVAQGGLLVGTGGSAMFDAYNDRNPAAVDLFGAKSVSAPAEADTADLKAAFTASEWFPATSLLVAAPRGHYYRLQPTTAQVLATYDGGEAACVTRQVGKGRTILFGFYPGFTFRGNGRALGRAQGWFNTPLLIHLGRQKVEYTFPASEATLFEHESGIAVTLANFSPWKAETSTDPALLSIATDRKINTVESALFGPLEWKQLDGRIEVTTPAPAELVVDTIILR